MSDTTTTTDPADTEPTGAQTQGEPADEPLGEPGKKALQAEREARKAAESKLSDLEKRLNEIERANETELERAQRERDEAKAAVEAVPQQVADHLRTHLAAAHNISDDDRDLYMTATDPETLLKQAMGLVERTSTGGPKPDLTQGGGSNGAPALNSNALEQALRDKLGII